MSRGLFQTVRDICLWLPESEEFISHGSPNFRVRGKTFASYVVNHHGDGRVALWIAAPPGAQDAHVRAKPKHFFVPPYVGVRGLLGVNLNTGLSFNAVAGLVREAYVKVAPSKLSDALGKTPAIKPPTETLSAAQIDPFKAKGAVKLLEQLRKRYGGLPEVEEGRQFGHPVFTAGKRTFLMVRHEEGKLHLSFWVGLEAQGMLTPDIRFKVPAYFGHQGWILLQLGARPDWQEIDALALASYRHFAKRRMLKALGEA